MKKIFSILVLLFNNAWPLTVGSDTTPSRQAAITFPTGTDNEILGFTALDAGFTFADANTSCIYNAFFPTSGIMNFRNGNFYLANDFLLNSDAYGINPGNVFGNLSAIIFSPLTTSTIFPQVATANPFSIYDLTVFFPNDTTLSAPLYVNGSCALIGAGNSITLNKSKPVVIQKDSELLLQNMIVTGLGLNAIACTDETSVIILKNVMLNLDYDYNFSHGSLLFQDDVVIRGTNKFTYSSPMTSTIDFNSTLFCDYGVSVSFDQQRNFTTPLYMSDLSSDLYLNGCTLFISRTGLELSQGTICFDNKVTISCEGKNTAGSLRIRYDVNTHVKSRALINLYGNIVVG